MATVTVRVFRDIGEQYLRPLVKDLRQAAAYALSGARIGGCVDPETVDVLVTRSSPFDVSAYDLVITVEAADSMERPYHAEGSVNHVLQEVHNSLQTSGYPQLDSLKYRVDLKLSFLLSASSDH
jgi:hypothetical protein